MLPLLEAIALFQSMVIGYEIRLLTDNNSLSLPVMHGIAFAGVMMLAMAAMGLYDEGRNESFRQTIQRVIMAYLVTMLVITVVFYLVPEAKFGRGIFAIATAFALSSLVAIRYVYHRAIDNGTPARKVLVVGEQEDIAEIEKTVSANNTRAASRIAGMFSLSTLAGDAPIDKAFASEHLANRVRQQGIKEIVVAVRDQRNGSVPMELLLNLRLSGTRIYDLLTFYERELGLIKRDHLRQSWLIFGEGFEQSSGRTVAKRAFDIIVSLLLLIVASPIMLLGLLAVFIDTGRPILFSQIRTGENGKPFRVYKFRSMRTDAEKDGTPKWATKNDDRVTRSGKFLRATRIDELPQLFNVLAGDMSFVGPRPERPYFVDELCEKIPFYDLRHKVKPGITGWAQVRLPYASSVEAAGDKLEYDLYYVKNNSVLFDMIILFETARVVLTRKGH